MSFEQGGVCIVPHLLWLGTSDLKGRVLYRASLAVTRDRRSEQGGVCITPHLQWRRTTYLNRKGSISCLTCCDSGPQIWKEGFCIAPHLLWSRNDRSEQGGVCIMPHLLWRGTADVNRKGFVSCLTCCDSGPQILQSHQFSCFLLQAQSTEDLF